jgi:hypothetical protein
MTTGSKAKFRHAFLKRLQQREQSVLFPVSRFSIIFFIRDRTRRDLFRGLRPFGGRSRKEVRIEIREVSGSSEERQIDSVSTLCCVVKLVLLWKNLRVRKAESRSRPL